MTSILRFAVAIPLLVALLSGCVAPAKEADHAQLPATSRGLTWFRYSAERRAVYAQSYLLAEKIVHDDIPARRDKTLPWAVVLDVDETVLDNSEYQDWIEQHNNGKFAPVQWTRWANEARAPAFPSALHFMKVVHESGGLVVLITNRRQALCEVTRRNLQTRAAQFDELLCLPDAAPVEEKQTRFAQLKSGAAFPLRGRLDVQLFVGDNILDCANQTQDAVNPALFGVSCISLPNPVYGSWMGRTR